MADGLFSKIDDDKLNHISGLVQAQVPGITGSQVFSFLCNTNWHPEEHQPWLDTAAEQEIADWVLESRDDILGGKYDA
jgi:hypothetical protein